MDSEKIKEILRKQLQLLAKESKNCPPECLSGITSAMLDIVETLKTI